jgi:hypothetical protein
MVDWNWCESSREGNNEVMIDGREPAELQYARDPGKECGLAMEGDCMSIDVIVQ